MASSTASYVEAYEAPPTHFTGTRVGDATDILVLYYGNETEVVEYVQGFLFLGYFFALMYFLWSITLCTLMCCCGRKRVGFWSGRPFQKRSGSNKAALQYDSTDRMEDEDHHHDHPDDNDNNNHYNDNYNNSPPNNNNNSPATSCCTPAEPLCSVPNIIRIIFITTAFLICLLSILFATKGLQAMQQGTVDVYHTNVVRVQDLTVTGRQLLDQGSIAISQSADLMRTALQRESVARNFCPADPSLAQSPAARDAFDQVQDAADVIDYLQEYNQEKTAEVNRVLDDFQDDLRTAEQELDNVHVWNAGTAVLLVLYLLLMVAFIVATILAMLGKEYRILTKGLQWIGMPLLIILTLINLFWVVALPIAGGINSDFCLPSGQGSSPNDLVFEVLEREGFRPGNDRYDTAEYFIQYQCQAGKDPYKPLNGYLRELDTHQDTIVQLRSAIRDSDDIALYCERDFGELTTELDDLDRLINLLRSTAQDFKRSISCENLVPIYTSSVYDATCTNSTQAIMWLYMTSFFLVLFGYLMITLRAAYRISWVNEEDEMMEHDLKLSSNYNKNNAPPEYYPSMQYVEYDGQPVVAVPQSPQEQGAEAAHMMHPITITPSLSPLPVPSSPQTKNHAYDDGFDC